MTNQIPVKAVRTGSTVTALAEFESGDKISSDYLPTSTSGDAYYHHHQGTAADSWAIEHNLGKYPSVTVVDSSGNRGLCAVQYTDDNNLTVSFAAAFAGDAYLN
jgi:hypothetical protein